MYFALILLGVISFTVSLLFLKGLIETKDGGEVGYVIGLIFGMGVTFGSLVIGIEGGDPIPLNKYDIKYYNDCVNIVIKNEVFVYKDYERCKLLEDTSKVKIKYVEAAINYLLIDEKPITEPLDN